MKKALSAILAIVLLIGLSACAGKTEAIDAVKAGAVVIAGTQTAFEKGTEVTAETIQTGAIYDRAEEAVKEVAKQFTVYEFNAIKDGAQVQPNGSLAVTFHLPESYSHNSTVYYVAEDGTGEQLATTVDTNSRTVMAELTHFSTYVLADLGDTADTTTQSVTETSDTSETDEADETSETTTITAQNTTTTSKTTATTKTKTPPSRSTSTSKKTTTTGEIKWLEAVPGPSKQYGEPNRQTEPNADKNTTSNKTIQNTKKTTHKTGETTQYSGKHTASPPATSTKAPTTAKTTISKIDIKGKTFQGYGRVEDDGCYYDVTVTFGKGVGQAMYVDTRICAPVDEYCAEMGPDMTVDKFLDQVKKEEPDSLVLFEGKYYYAVMGGGPGDLVITSIDNSAVSFQTVPDTEHGETPIEYKIKFDIKGNDLTVRHIDKEFSHLAAGAVLTLVK